mgnify:CR=1 FL=1
MPSDEDRLRKLEITDPSTKKLTNRISSWLNPEKNYIQNVPSEGGSFKATVADKETSHLIVDKTTVTFDEYSSKKSDLSTLFNYDNKVEKIITGTETTETDEIKTGKISVAYTVYMINVINNFDISKKTTYFAIFKWKI